MAMVAGRWVHMGQVVTASWANMEVAVGVVWGWAGPWAATGHGHVSHRLQCTGTLALQKASLKEWKELVARPFNACNVMPPTEPGLQWGAPSSPFQ